MDYELGSSAVESSQATSKDHMVSHIKRWIQLDNEIKKAQDEIKAKKEQRKQHTLQLVNIMKTNEIDCFDINGGQLIYSKTKVKAPLNKNNLMNALLSFYNDDVSQAEKVSTFLMETREEKVKESIRRKRV